jgi:hypothetical protein
MRKIYAPLLASTLALSACATSPYGAGYGGMGGPLEAVLSSVLGASQGSYGGYGQSQYGGNFQQAAVQACGSTASRYGQVGISNVQQVSSSTLRVYGRVSNGYTGRNFACSFRSDGRITDFDI